MPLQRARPRPKQLRRLLRTRLQVRRLSSRMRKLARLQSRLAQLPKPRESSLSRRELKQKSSEFLLSLPELLLSRRGLQQKQLEHQPRTLESVQKMKDRLQRGPGVMQRQIEPQQKQAESMQRKVESLQSIYERPIHLMLLPVQQFRQVWPRSSMSILLLPEKMATGGCGAFRLTPTKILVSSQEVVRCTQPSGSPGTSY